MNKNNIVSLVAFRSSLELFLVGLKPNLVGQAAIATQGLRPSPTSMCFCLLVTRDTSSKSSIRLYLNHSMRRTSGTRFSSQIDANFPAYARKMSSPISQTHRTIGTSDVSKASTPLSLLLNTRCCRSSNRCYQNFKLDQLQKSSIDSSN